MAASENASPLSLGDLSKSNLRKRGKSREPDEAAFA